MPVLSVTNGCSAVLLDTTENDVVLVKLLIIGQIVMVIEFHDISYSKRGNILHMEALDDLCVPSPSKATKSAI